MVDKLGSGGGALAREAVLAAMKAQAERSAEIRESAASLTDRATSQTQGAAEPDFADKLREGLDSVDQKIKGVDDLQTRVLYLSALRDSDETPYFD